MNACAFCGSPAECRCDAPGAVKRLALPAAEVVPSDRIAFRAHARRTWKVLQVYSLGVVVVLDLECRVRRFARLWPTARPVTVIRTGRCDNPCCERHARDLGGKFWELYT